MFPKRFFLIQRWGSDKSAMPVFLPCFGHPWLPWGAQRRKKARRNAGHLAGSGFRVVDDGDMRADLVKATGAWIKQFGQGELWLNLRENVRGRNICVIQSTCAPASGTVNLGFARRKRKERGRAALSAKPAANPISTAGADRMISLDLRAGQIQGFLDIPVDHLYAGPLLAEHVRGFRLGDIGTVGTICTAAPGRRANLLAHAKRAVRKARSEAWGLQPAAGQAHSWRRRTWRVKRH